MFPWLRYATHTPKFSKVFDCFTNISVYLVWINLENYILTQEKEFFKQSIKLHVDIIKKNLLKLIKDLLLKINKGKTRDFFLTLATL